MHRLRRWRRPTAGLHTKLAVTLALLVALVAAGSVAFLIERERGERMRQLEARATRIADVLGEALAQEVSSLDKKAIQRQLDAIAPDPELAEVTVTATGYGTVAAAGPRNASAGRDGVVRVRPITYTEAEGLPPQTIGEVRVVLSRAEAEVAGARARRALFAMAAAVVLTIYAGMSVLLRRLLLAPLTRLEATVDRLAAGDLDTRCPVDSADELGRLARRVNVMADQLRESTVRVSESEERFRTLVQFSFDVYWETDAQHRFTRQDLAEGLVDGPAPGSEIGKTRWEVPYLEPDEEAWRQHRATLDAHLPFRDFELARPTADGGRRYVSVSGLPVFDETGRFIGYRGVGQHITARKRSEQALRQSQAYLAEAQRLTQTGSWAYNPATGKVTYWSDEAFRILGLDPRGRLPERDELVRLVHPEDLEGVAGPIASALRGGTDFAHEFRVVLADGSVRHLHAIGHPVFDQAGTLVEYFGTVVDVTERKRSEEAHRAHLWFLESMDRISRAMQATDDLQRMMSDVLGAALDIFGCDRAWLTYPCDPDAASWRVVVERTRPEFPGEPAGGTELPLDAEGAMVFAAARASSGAVLLGPAYELKVPTQRARRFNIQSQMAMALVPKRDRPYLFGLHQCSHARIWTAHEERLFVEIGRRLTDSLTGLLMVRSLRESERRLEAAQQIAGVGWWERDCLTGELSVSDEACWIFGVQPVDLPRWRGRWLSLIHPDDRPRAVAASQDVEYRVVRADGTVRAVHSRGDALWNESGPPMVQFGVVQDITELRRVEDELRASEARFRTLVDHATDAFLLHDERQIVIDVNRQACESLGYRREELVGMSIRDLDVGLDTVSFARVGARVTEGEPVTFETSYRRKDGGVFPVEVRSRRFQQGERVLHLALARDIRERKRAEKRIFTQHAVAQILAEAATMEEATPKLLQAICENLDWDLGALWQVDGETGVLRCAQVWHTASLDAGPFEAVTRKTVFAPGVGLPGRVWVSRVPAWVSDVTQDPTFVRAREAAHSGLHAAFAFPILLGREVLAVLDFESRDIRGPDQDLLDLMATLGSQIGQFIERKRAEDSLRLARSEVAHLARVMTVGELTASIAHEVNQPLLGIVSSASSCSRWLAAEPPNLPRAQRALERIMEAGTRASAVVDRVRILVNRQPLRTGPVDVNEVVHDVIAMIRHELLGAGVSLRTRLAERMPSVEGDRVQLQQVVLNLILNAIEATRDVKGRARLLEVVSRVERGRAVHVEVRDSGVGLAPESQARVFEAFYTTKESGLGMGLSISRSIVEAHGGRISARPNSPYGAVFQFWVPLVPEGTSVA